ncbi:helix-turn-helix transcriptional regulator [Roseomonas sp. PWR1]|uniref:Helix-turn-helix transcriptional regulator n=1 Tax=Roseomonas nitratireducens TaxID=2820810 RepID=A0ABS4AZ62_9PROT|nr:helix-turn-helix transcriptional regulator [Neoroseomonas nitratireducens]MBP0466544.1 helix-turn-helix transcriptional regulator [Neoroseomonas nitratireducens]
MAKPTDVPGAASADPARECADRVGLRSALPFRLESLGTVLPGPSVAQGEQARRVDPAKASRAADATADAGHRHTLNAVDTHVGARIRLRRHLLGLSQTMLAKELGVTFQQLQKYERGLNRISASRLHDLGRALDTSISYFFHDMPSGIGETSAVPLETGDAGELDNPELDRLHRRETLNLVRAYYTLEDPEVRRHILDLVGSLGSPT